MRSRVVFPEPEEPSRTRNSPSRIDRSTPSTACRSPKCFLRLRISMPATVGALAPGLSPVGRGIRRLRQVDRRGIDEVVRAVGYLEWLHDLRRRARGGACPPPGAPPPRPPPEGHAPQKMGPDSPSGLHRFPLTPKKRR